MIVKKGWGFMTVAFAVLLCAFFSPLVSLEQTFSLSLDADNALGDQSILSVDVPAGDIVPIQIIGHGLRGSSVLRFRLEYDRYNLTYDDLARSYITYYDGRITYTAGHDWSYEDENTSHFCLANGVGTYQCWSRDTTSKVNGFP